MQSIKVGDRVSEFDQEAIPVNNRDGGPAYRGKRVFGTVTKVTNKYVVINWDVTPYYDLGEIKHGIWEIGQNIQIEKPAAE